MCTLREKIQIGSPLRGHELTGMNSLYKNVLAKQNRSSRQLHRVVTSNQHMHFLSLFVIVL